MAKKRFTVGFRASDGPDRERVPYITLGGHWLREYGFDAGDKLELIKSKNMLVFVKAAKTD